MAIICSIASSEGKMDSISIRVVPSVCWDRPTPGDGGQHLGVGIAVIIGESVFQLETIRRFDGFHPPSASVAVTLGPGHVVAHLTAGGEIVIDDGGRIFHVASAVRPVGWNDVHLSPVAVRVCTSFRPLSRQCEGLSSYVHRIRIGLINQLHGSPKPVPGPSRNAIADRAEAAEKARFDMFVFDDALDEISDGRHGFGIGAGNTADSG